MSTVSASTSHPRSRAKAGEVDRASGFFKAVQQDPVLARVKLIAEPWDAAAGGYQVGNFPPGWAEWNDRYRNGMRAYWKGDGGMLGEFARRFAGSSDLVRRCRAQAARGRKFRHRARRIHAARPGLVQREAQRDERRRQPRRPRSQSVVELRSRRADRRPRESTRCASGRSATSSPRCCFRRGVPMLLAGDECSRTQHGNNNAYCHDDETNWIDWSETPERAAFTEFVRKLIALRRSHRTFRRRDFYHGRPLGSRAVKDVVW
jgi:glycogen operon protein